ncbi:unnamed protein product [Rotaria socialis]|uniref:FAD-binding FR-type domain-containing protein n=1 Tax=Rotaria socialis TaxID=392032 RepID=A0A821FFN2_9BILA|nr:unnamed protein product [Rotaria socialis]
MNRRRQQLLTAQPSIKSISRSRAALIQLRALLDDPPVALPTRVRRADNSSSTEKKLTIEEVAKMLNTQPFIIERIINALNRFSKTNEFQSLSQIHVHKMTRILTSTMEVRSLLFFAIMDEEQDDFVTTEGFVEFFESYLKGIRSFNHALIPEYVRALVKKFHLQHQSEIDFDDFYSIVCQDPTLLESLSKFTVDPSWFVSNDSTQEPRKPNAIQHFFINMCSEKSIDEDRQSIFSMNYIRDNASRVVFLLLYVLINLALCLYVVIYRSVVLKDHVLVIFARIGGMLLNFNCALIVLLMLKHIILVIRSSEHLRKWIPTDDHIAFHKHVARFIAFLSIVHTIAHMANFGRVAAIEKKFTWPVYMFTTTAKLGWIGPGFAPLSGVVLCIIFTVMIIGSLHRIRRGGHFQIFYWTHLLYVVFYIFLILHAENCWKWVIGPLSLLLIEKAYSILTRYSSGIGRTYIKSATIEQSNVISLKIHRPRHFTFKPGDYISINIPRIALYEYHPFTISSAPEETSYLTVHIQATGNWTKRVYQRFKDMSDKENHKTAVRIYRADRNTNGATSHEAVELQGIENNTMRATRRQREVIFINGPYSSCARYVFDCRHVVLIGGGIGITPYASILSSLMAQFRASRVVCKHCHGINYNQPGLLENNRLRKVDFIWINRDHKNFEWFLNLLRQFEEEQEQYLESNPDEHRFLDIHLFFTEIKNDERIGNVPLDLITKIWAQVAGHDIFTNLNTKTHIGRPKWDELFRGFNTDQTETTQKDVSVFFCGPSAMGQTIRKHCVDCKFRYYEEKF